MQLKSFEQLKWHILGHGKVFYAIQYYWRLQREAAKWRHHTSLITAEWEERCFIWRNWSKMRRIRVDRSATKYSQNVSGSIVS